jgi:hypothetical protein
VQETTTARVVSLPSEWRSWEWKSSGRSSSTYRTMCVRLCDGFYWPISFATTNGSIGRDSKLCSDSCNAPTALYYYPNPGAEIEEMVNLKGEPYTRLSTAFLYRVKYDASCKCRAHPWEQEAMAQHQKYAEDAQSEPDRDAEQAVKDKGRGKRSRSGG